MSSGIYGEPDERQPGEERQGRAAPQRGEHAEQGDGDYDRPFRVLD